LTQLVDEHYSATRLADVAGNLPRGLAHQASLETDMGITHTSISARVPVLLPSQLPRCQRQQSERVDQQFPADSPVSGWETSRFVISTQCSSVVGSGRVQHRHRRQCLQLLHFRDRMQRRRAYRNFRTIDFNHSPLQAATQQDLVSAHWKSFPPSWVVSPRRMIAPYQAAIWLSTKLRAFACQHTVVSIASASILRCVRVKFWASGGDTYFRRSAV